MTAAFWSVLCNTLFNEENWPILFLKDATVKMALPAAGPLFGVSALLTPCYLAVTSRPLWAPGWQVVGGGGPPLHLPSVGESGFVSQTCGECVYRGGVGRGEFLDVV